MNMSFDSLCLHVCPLSLTVKLDFNISQKYIEIVAFMLKNKLHV